MRKLATILTAILVNSVVGCSPGTIWNQAHLFPSKPSGAERSVSATENLTEHDRQQLTSLIDRKPWTVAR